MTNETKVRINEETILGRLLIRFYRRLYKNYAVVGVITGAVRVGKSRGVMLNVNDYWYKVLMKSTPPEYSINSDTKNYITSLRNANKYELCCLDEAIDSIGKGNSGTKLLSRLNNMFGICGERKVASLIVLDNIFELTTKIATRFITFWIHVDKRVDNICRKCKADFTDTLVCPSCGSTEVTEGWVEYRFYSKKRLIDILTINEARTIKGIYNTGIRPNFRSSIKQYKGELSDYYSNLKKQKTDLTMKELEDDFGINSGMVNRESRSLNKKIIELKYKDGLTNKEIADQCGITEVTVSQKIRKIAEML